MFLEFWLVEVHEEDARSHLEGLVIVFAFRGPVVISQFKELSVVK
jgi:hypothetical protein